MSMKQLLSFSICLTLLAGCAKKAAEPVASAPVEEKPAPVAVATPAPEPAKAEVTAEAPKAEEPEAEEKPAETAEAKMEETPVSSPVAVAVPAERVAGVKYSPEVFYKAVASGDLEKVQALAAKASSRVLTKALSYAIKEGGGELVSLLVDAGADGSVFLVDAAKAVQDPEVIKPLAKGASKGKLDGALLMASANNCPEVVQLLLDSGADVDSRDSWGDTALMYAARSNENSEVVTLLAKAGADLEAVDIWNRNALALAVDNLQVAEALVEAGADVNNVLVSGRPALVWALESGNAGLVDGLLAAGAKVDARDVQGRSAFMVAVEQRDETMARKLVEKGADVNARDDWGRSALMGAAWRGDLDAVKLLVEEGKADVTQEDVFGRTATDYARDDAKGYLEGKAPAAPQKIAGTSLRIRRSISNAGGYSLDARYRSGDLDVQIEAKAENGKGELTYKGVPDSVVEGFLKDESDKIDGLTYEMGESGTASYSYPSFGALDDRLVTDWLLEDARP